MHLRCLPELPQLPEPLDAVHPDFPSGVGPSFRNQPVERGRGITVDVIHGQGWTVVRRLQGIQSQGGFSFKEAPPSDPLLDSHVGTALHFSPH